MGVDSSVDVAGGSGFGKGFEGQTRMFAPPGVSSERDAPLVLVRTVADRRVVVGTCGAAHAAGVRVGFSLAQARALCPSIVHVEHDAGRDAKALEALGRHGCVREVRGKGVLLGVEFSVPGLGVALKKTALANGIILRVDPDWFAVSPAIIATEAEIDEMCALIEKSLVEALAHTAPR